MIWFGLLFAAAIAGGRSSFGLSDAGTTRYVTFDLLILVGSCLLVLERSHRVKRMGCAGCVGSPERRLWWPF
jgi:hypothetical protein